MPLLLSIQIKHFEIFLHDQVEFIIQIQLAQWI